MAEDRQVQDQVEAIRALRAELDDMRSTLLARASRRPTGDVELAFRATPKPGTLFLQGQTLNRADYPALWAWAQASGSVVAGGYGAGNGTTTFTVPNMQGRVLMGAGTLGTDTYALGALTGVARHTLTTGEMPSHNHTPFNGSMSSAGGHNQHNQDFRNFNNGSGANGVASFYTAFDAGVDKGSHTHAFSLEISNTGGGGAHENRQPSLAVNFAVWT